MTEGNGNGGDLRPGGRFERIERLLERIEIKLDAKAEQSDLDRISERLEATSRLVGEQIAAATPLMEQFRAVVRDVETLKTSGSPDAKQALDATQEHERRISKLETRAAVEDAVNSVRGEVQANRKWLIGVVAASLVTLIAAILQVSHALNPNWP